MGEEGKKDLIWFENELTSRFSACRGDDGNDDDDEEECGSCVGLKEQRREKDSLGREREREREREITIA